MSTKSDFKHALCSILKHNRDGSRNTQSCRRRRLLHMSAQLAERGYQLRHPNELKPRHIRYLVQYWQSQRLNAGTIKNRLTDLRWLAEKLNRRGLLPGSNTALHVEKRHAVTHQDKSIEVSPEQLAQIRDPDVAMSLQLQKAFGLRREESIKIRIHEAVVGDELRLRGSWCKNGRPRTIKIRTPSQWETVRAGQAYITATHRALIPENKSYYQQLKTYENELARAGIHKAHGLRHAYAQARYQEITGWRCPAKGGLSTKQMTSQQHELDHQARQHISTELGHERLTVVAIYCGK